MLEDIVREWITRITKEGDLPEDCLAIYIGLFEGESCYMLHFVGSVDFDSEDSDWHVMKKMIIFPKTDIWRAVLQQKQITLNFIMK